MDFLFWAVVFFGAGLLVGWNVLPQPAWVVRAYDKAVAWVKEKLNK